MIIKHTGFEQLLLIYQNKSIDKRGFFKEIFKKELLEAELNYEIDFCQSNFVKSNLNVLRGLHYQIEPYAQSKLISVFSGKILDVAVDIRKHSETYGKYFSYFLSEEDNVSLFIPKGFAHGYISLSENTVINYLVDNDYNPKMERGIRFSDEYLKINWNVDIEKIIVSKKDSNFDKFKW